jgi:hypothetical protein
MLPVIEAFANGKTIQWLNEGGNWEDMSSIITFTYDPDRYRIKPEALEIRCSLRLIPGKAVLDINTVYPKIRLLVDRDTNEVIDIEMLDK